MRHSLGVLDVPRRPTETVPLNLTEVILAQGSTHEGSRSAGAHVRRPAIDFVGTTMATSFPYLRTPAASAALAAFAAAPYIFPDKRIHLQYTTTSPKLHKVLGVETPVFD